MSFIQLQEHADEEATFIVPVQFLDEDDNPVTPNAGLKWHLTDKFGKVINSRKDVALTPGTSVDIVLEGADLVILQGHAEELRVLTVEGTYDSSAGTGLPLKIETRFWVDNLVKIPSS